MRFRLEDVFEQGIQFLQLSFDCMVDSLFFKVLIILSSICLLLKIFSVFFDLKLPKKKKVKIEKQYQIDDNQNKIEELQSEIEEHQNEIDELRVQIEQLKMK